MPKYLQDICSGITFLCISLAFWVQYKQLSGVSRIFPEALITLITLGGVYYLIKGYFRYRKEKAEKQHEEKEQFLFMRLVFILFASIILIFLIEFLGFYTASFIFLFISYIFLANKRGLKVVRNSFIFSVCFMFAVWLLFHYILLVPTPAGLFI